MARRRGFRIPGVSFSWRRAVGISAAQARLSRRIGIPLSRSGRQRKIGRAAGCMLPLTIGIGGLLATAWFLTKL